MLWIVEIENNIFKVFTKHFKCENMVIQERRYQIRIDRGAQFSFHVDFVITWIFSTVTDFVRQFLFEKIKK